ncbi:hypothetical protein OIDMADRAFT_17788 [Oidiodendron maius Zn]|uniref:Uncharacterized protein n=1 Tax=Oidiodendron maius (strain Zn) TaxID=913774 RepID=A0A0C3H9N5_OIDMZ|nr:hypothetical protein OIDMADRAFT_17788 [Oidiodendron maius Zn]
MTNARFQREQAADGTSLSKKVLPHRYSSPFTLSGSPRSKKFNATLIPKGTVHAGLARSFIERQ